MLTINYNILGAPGTRITELIGWFGYVPHDWKLWVQFPAEVTFFSPHITQISSGNHADCYQKAIRFKICATHNEIHSSK
jgi:hypothetical protein